MDKKKIEILKKIQECRDNNISPDFESLGKEGFEKSILRVMIKEELINWAGVFSLTEKGEKILRDYLIVESQKQKDKLKILFDSNIFDEIIAGNLKINEIVKFKENAEFYITHLQVDEINDCSNIEKRAKLFLFMAKLAPIVISTSSFIPDKSRLGEARLGDGIIFKELKNGNGKHTDDALIGETAIKEKLTLVTNDRTLRNKVNSKGGNAISSEEFKKMMSIGSEVV